MITREKKQTGKVVMRCYKDVSVFGMRSLWKSSFTKCP